MPEIIAEKYEVIETIGRGGMGTVYKARQRNLDRIVAIKMLSEELASDPEFRARFQQEATVVARLNHPNIVQVHDIEPHNNTFCIIMEFVDGENLQAKIDRDVTLSEREVVTIGAQVSRALAYAHGRGVIHRDIKPDNIHVTPKGVAKVMDFGIARYTDSKLKTQTGISMGTPKFMSPEQVTGKNVDGQTDLYSLGICLYYCLAGRPPFDGENAISVATRHLYEQPEPPSKMNSSISPAVEQVILHAMEKQKQNRFTTGIEMAEALEAALEAKTSVRLSSETDENFAGTTQKIPAQAYGTPASAPLPNLGTQSFSSTEKPIVPADIPNARMTPLSTRSVPELDPNFRTPSGELKTHDPTQSFRFSLVIFGGLVVLAAVILIVLVLWLRRNDVSDQPDASPQARAASPVERLESTDAEADTLLRAGNAMGARTAWLKFQTDYPQVETDRVIMEIKSVESQLPLSEAEILAERRRQQGFDHLNQQHLAMAAAYLKGAAAISKAVASSAITSNTLQTLLQRKLGSTPAPTEIADAAENFAAGKKALENSILGDGTRDFLMKAVEANYQEPTYWVTLGDFFLQKKQLDDARVMYGEALGRSTLAAQKAAIQQKLDSVSK